MTRHPLCIAAVSALGWFGVAERAPVTLHLIGDSTMAEKPDPEHNPERGWGQSLPEFTRSGTIVRNYARNGRSTKSFIAEQRWDSVRTNLRRGDYVFIQFGHNDEKAADTSRYAAPRTDYRRNLERFVREAREAGAVPVLFTPIARRQFGRDGALEGTHGDYPAVVRELAAQQHVPLIDLEQATTSLLRSLGDQPSRPLFVFTRDGEFPAFPAARADNTHLSPVGARTVASLAVRALITRIPALGDCCLSVPR